MPYLSYLSLFPSSRYPFGGQPLALPLGDSLLGLEPPVSSPKGSDPIREYEFIQALPLTAPLPLNLQVHILPYTRTSLLCDPLGDIPAHKPIPFLKAHLPLPIFFFFILKID